MLLCVCVCVIFFLKWSSIIFYIQPMLRKGWIIFLLSLFSIVTCFDCFWYNSCILSFLVSNWPGDHFGYNSFKPENFVQIGM